MPEYDLDHPPWATEEYEGHSDNWGDEQDRSEWFEAAAGEWHGRAQDAERRIARALGILLPSEIVEAIGNVVDYNLGDEEHDYETWKRENEGEADDSHIVHALRQLNGFLETMR